MKGCSSLDPQMAKCDFPYLLAMVNAIGREFVDSRGPDQTSTHSPATAPFAHFLHLMPTVLTGSGS